MNTIIVLSVHHTGQVITTFKTQRKIKINKNREVVVMFPEFSDIKWQA